MIPHVRPEDVKALTKCPACGSGALAATESRRSRAARTAIGVALLSPAFPGPKGKKCLDCGWQVE